MVAAVTAALVAIAVPAARFAHLFAPEERVVGERLGLKLLRGTAKNGDNIYGLSNRLPSTQHPDTLESTSHQPPQGFSNSNDAWEALLDLTDGAYKTMSSYESAVPNSASNVGVRRIAIGVKADAQRKKLEAWQLIWADSADKTSIHIATQMSDLLGRLSSLARHPSERLRTNYFNSYLRLNAILKR